MKIYMMIYKITQKTTKFYKKKILSLS